jgi:hypothetical protein
MKNDLPERSLQKENRVHDEGADRGIKNQPENELTKKLLLQLKYLRFIFDENLISKNPLTAKA